MSERERQEPVEVPWAKGEKCACGKDAFRKVEDSDTPAGCHPWTTYLCEWCWKLHFGEYAHQRLAPRREPDRPGSLVEALERFEPWMVAFLQNAAEDEPAWKHRLLSIHDAITRALAAQEADHE